MRLFPEVRPDRGFDLGENEPSGSPDDGPGFSETKNGEASWEAGHPALLTDSQLVRVIDEKAPPVGLEPTTQRLTAACSTN